MKIWLPFCSLSLPQLSASSQMRMTQNTEHWSRAGIQFSAGKPKKLVVFVTADSRRLNTPIALSWDAPSTWWRWWEKGEWKPSNLCYRQHVPPLAGHWQHRAAPSLTGEIMQVCPSCCCQTTQPTLLPVDHTYENCRQSVITHVQNLYLYIPTVNYLYLVHAIM